MHPFHIPPLHGDRVTVRRLTRADESALIAMRLSGNSSTAPDEVRRQVQPWLAWTVHAYDQLEALYQPPYGERGIEVDASLVSVVGLVPSFDAFGQIPSLGGVEGSARSAEVGLYWEVHADAQRQGFATEAARLLAAFAFDHLRAGRLVATTEHNNVASIAVMRNLGMTIERNPYGNPAQLQTVGVLSAPA